MLFREYNVGGVYHIFNRGYEKRNIFHRAKDYFRFIEAMYVFNSENSFKIKDLRKRYGDNLLETMTRSDIGEKLVEILGFVLMKNHFHLILKEIRDKGTSEFMRKLSNAFTGYYNTFYERKGLGGIFQSRYKSVRVVSDAQLTALFSYVHTNPIEITEKGWKGFEVRDPKGAVKWLESYRWSSWPVYLEKPSFSQVVDSDFYFKFMDGKDGCLREVKNWVKYKAKNFKSNELFLE